MEFDPNHALDVMQKTGAPWWAVAVLIIVLAFFWRGPAVIAALNDLIKTQRQLSHKHRENMHKLENAAEPKFRQLPPPTNHARLPPPRTPQPAGRKRR